MGSAVTIPETVTLQYAPDKSIPIISVTYKTLGVSILLLHFVYVKGNVDRVCMPIHEHTHIDLHRKSKIGG